ncbi:NAD(P)H-binding protein [Thalassotalea sp. M1531]|uniref:NAD(P)H-binding protein n=1 Tax=Thalassotalea algicola TaxID=2716224 RepID=A0A7Y0LDT1_9GAMM|nr:NAD(P)H-binding protein [Thalassotalea algicola]NMP32700.1 NAD(P)H-binding protein [Thalassotalea algicola]
MGSTAIIIGATGAVGSCLLKLLLADDTISRIIALTRSPLKLKHEKLKEILVDFQQLEQYRNHISGDVFFSCLGTTKKQAGSITKQRIVDLEYQLLAATLAAKNKVNHYQLVSSAGANADSNSPYLAMKGELEEAICKLPFESITILQPSLLLAKRVDFRLGEWLSSQILPLICLLPGLKKYRPIKAKTVAEKMLGTFKKPTSGIKFYRLDQIFNIQKQT